MARRGSTRSQWHYDISACIAPQSPKPRQPAIACYDLMPTHNIGDHRGIGSSGQSPCDSLKARMKGAP